MGRDAADRGEISLDIRNDQMLFGSNFQICFSERRLIL